MSTPTQSDRALAAEIMGPKYNADGKAVEVLAELIAAHLEPERRAAEKLNELLHELMSSHADNCYCRFCQARRAYPAAVGAQNGKLTHGSPLPLRPASGSHSDDKRTT